MKIPVYKNKVPYQSVYARNVNLARPLKEASGHSGWSKWQETGALMQTGVIAHEYAEKFLKKSKKDEEKMNPAGGFSSQERSNFQQFCQKNIFRSLSGGQEESSVEKLDEYVAQRPDLFEKDSVLPQDYAVLRHAAAEIQRQKQKQWRKERWAEGEQIFIKTSSAIPTAQALAEYVQKNLAAAEKEALNDGMNQEEWKKLKHKLRQQAIVQNVQTSLQTGDWARAAQTCQHFSQDIPPETARVLNTQITYRKAAEQVHALPEEVYEKLRKEDGTFSSQKAALFVEKLSVPASEKGIFGQVLSARLAAQTRQEFSHKAAIYKDLYLQNFDAAESRLLQQSRGAVSHMDGIQKAFSALSGSIDKPHKDVFNAQYEKILLGQANQTEIEKLFEEKKLNAQEYVLLQYKFCQRCAAEQEPEEILLLPAVEQLTKRQNYREAEKQALKYMIYTAGIQFQDHLSAAKRASRILQLQEVEK